MAKNAMTVTVSRPGFIATETFISTTDAQAWKDMVETTLEHIDKIHPSTWRFTQPDFAETVRAHGGPYTQDKRLALRCRTRNGSRDLSSLWTVKPCLETA